MKKLFTLSLALMVAAAGYSQVRTSTKDLRAAQMKKVARTETLSNVQSQPNMTRIDFESGDLDYTTYDWQSNSGPLTRTIVWPDGKVNFAFTYASDDSYADRGTAIGTYDSNTGEWIPCGGRVEQERTGFGTIARYKENGIVVAAHTSNECGIYIIENKDEIAPECAITKTKINNDYAPAWPNVMTSGANRDIIHLIATPDGVTVDGVKDPVLYFRSTDGGETWDKENVILPFCTSEYGLSWGSNCAYWMETTADNCLALVINNGWEDGMVIYSYDDGETWERKVFYHHPGPAEQFTTDAMAFAYPRWTSAQWGIGGELCVAYEWNGTNDNALAASSGYYPGLGGVAFWAENLPYAGEGYAPNGYDPNNPMPPTTGQPFIMDSAYIYNDNFAAWPRWSDQTYDNPYNFGYVAPLDENGEWQSWEDAADFLIEDFTKHGTYNCGIAAFPVLCVLPGSGGFDMVTVWSALDEHHADAAGNYYYKLFAAYSGDGGHTWSTPKHLTNNFLFTYNECIYNQAAVVGENLIIASQMDQTPGSFVQNNDSDGGDNLYQGIVFDLKEIFPDAGVGMPEVENTLTMNIYPNPAVDQLNVNLSKSGTVSVHNMMGQLVKTFEGNIGINTIDVSSLSSGVYFISAGNSTQKFVVK